MTNGDEIDPILLPRQARIHVQHSYKVLREVVGEDHPQTRNALEMLRMFDRL